jgi:site-specific DNA-methyltransferase (adenine-specific)
VTPDYADDLVTIYHGDMREVLPLVEVDTVLTDPPYGISLDTRARYHANEDHAPIAGDDEPFDPSAIVALGVPTILWGANHYASRLPDMRGWLIWNKVLYDGSLGTRSMDKRQAEAELAWTNCVPRPKGYRHLWDGVYRDSEHGTRYHPAQKPVELMRWCIGFLPDDDDQSIVDPYMGAGPVLVAAKSLGRRAVGIEIEERYCEIAARRCSQEVLGLVW